jgi:hypothetical protein
MAFLVTGSVLSIIGTIASAWGAIQSGRQQEAAAKFASEMELGRAVQERAAAAIEERRHRKRSAKLLSTQKSLFLKAGVRMEGTPLEVITETATEAEFDAMLIRGGGYARSAEAMFRRGIYRMQGKGAREAGYLRAGTTLLTGFGKAWGSATTLIPMIGG